MPEVERTAETIDDGYQGPCATCGHYFIWHSPVGCLQCDAKSDPHPFVEKSMAKAQRSSNERSYLEWRKLPAGRWSLFIVSAGKDAWELFHSDEPLALRIADEKSVVPATADDRVHWYMHYYAAILARIAEGKAVDPRGLAKLALDEHSPLETSALPPDEYRVMNLVSFVRRLARLLRKHEPDSKAAVQALDYLERQGLRGSPLREAEDSAKTRCPVREQWSGLQCCLYAGHSGTSHPVNQPWTPCATCGGRGVIGGALADGSYQTDPCPACSPEETDARCPATRFTTDDLPCTLPAAHAGDHDYVGSPSEQSVFERGCYALMEMMQAYERRVRTDCLTPEDLAKRPWECAEYIKAANYLRSVWPISGEGR